MREGGIKQSTLGIIYLQKDIVKEPIPAKYTVEQGLTKEMFHN